MYGYGNSMFLATNGILAAANAGTPPVNTVAPVISGTQVVGSSLSTTNGTWTGSPAPTFTYQWYRGATIINGATSSAYTLVQADAGNTSNITCQVTGTNGLGSATATSNTLVQIFDFDANAFITAASITNPTQQSAINTLVTDLKGYNIWTRFKSIYPIVGGIASSHAVNLKTPGTYNLTFTSGWTHSSTGMTPTNAYADTFLTPSTSLSLNSAHLSYYSRTNSNGTEVEIGVNTSTNYNLLEIRTSGTTYFLINQAAFTTVSDSDSRGFYLGNRQASNDIDGWRKGVKVVNGTTVSTGLPTNKIYIGAYNNNGTASAFTTKQCTFASIGDGLTDTDAANFYTAVQAFQTTLGRQV